MAYFSHGVNMPKVKMKQETKKCKDCQKNFTIEPDDLSFYEKMDVPKPESCPECRQQLRMLFRNFKTLYKRPSSLSGKMIISVYDTNTPFPVYDISEWWSDDWDPMSYAIDIDWNVSFFSQLAKLLSTIPHISLRNMQNENCEYSNQILRSKNCYLAFGCVDSEDCDYGHIVWNCRDSMDNLYLFKCESCYECVDCLESTKLSFSQECEACVDSIGLFDEYILKERDALRRQVPQRSFFGSHNNDVSGNHIYNAHNVHDSFDIKSGENSRFCFTLRKAIDSYDISFTTDLEECYQCLTIDKGNKVIGSQNIVDSHDIYYSEYCDGSNNLFGCYGLRKKSYCIFNKQYSQKEYQELFPKLIKHMIKNKEWGLFPSKELTPFAYNESIANEYMPLTKEDALAKGFRWKDDIPSTKGQGTMEYEDLPKDPEDYSEVLLAQVLTCENCEKNYKLISREINFYKKNKLALPSKCFNCRHALRMGKRNKRTLWAGKCAKCGMDIETSYKPEDQKIYKIYCEKCYQQEVY